jgi:hypothetical protein
MLKGYGLRPSVSEEIARIDKLFDSPLLMSKMEWCPLY